MRLKNKVAIVTGSSRGIGRAIALLFGAYGRSDNGNIKFVFCFRLGSCKNKTITNYKNVLKQHYKAFYKERSDNSFFNFLGLLRDYILLYIEI